MHAMVCNILHRAARFPGCSELGRWDMQLGINRYYRIVTRNFDFSKYRDILIVNVVLKFKWYICFMYNM